jgi:hypothetical protein
MDFRINTYKKFHDGYGEILVQMNVEDTRNGVAEYVIDKYGDKVIIELKWGQGAKDIGGEIQVTTYEYARFLKDRGYVVDPDPSLPQVKEAFEHHAIRAFARHSRLGYSNMPTAAAVQEAFMQEVARLRKLGYNRITLKTGSYGMEALAMAIKFATDAKLDLLTIDGSGIVRPGDLNVAFDVASRNQRAARDLGATGDHLGRGKHDSDLQRRRSELVVVIGGERAIALLFGDLGARRQFLAPFLRFGFGVVAGRGLFPVGDALFDCILRLRARSLRQFELEALGRGAQRGHAYGLGLEERPQI